MFYAHAGPPEEDWHALRDHLEDSAALAERFASAFGSGPWGRIAGLWHDLGKYSAAFQEYLRASGGAEEGVHRSDLIGRVDHSTAGAKHAASFGTAGHLLAYCIAGHRSRSPCGSVD